MIGETLGLASISSNARASGYSVLYLDAHFENLTVAATVDAIADRSPGVVGILLRFPYVSIVETITASLRRRLPGALLVVGGQYASINAGLVLEWLPAIDGVCLGNGEEPILDILSGRMRPGKKSHSVIWRHALHVEEAVPNTSDRRSGSLDSLAWPDRKYLRMSNSFGYEAVGISSSRGCPFRCSFCVPHAYSQTSLSSPWQFRSAASAVDEIEHHVECGDNSFTFSDEHFLPNKVAKRRAAEMARLLRERKTNAKFMFDCRADAVDVELFEELVQAGLYRVYVGFEAADEDMLMDYVKDQRLHIYERCLAILSQVGVEVIPGMIMFSPFTRADQLLRNVTFFAENFSTFAEEDFLSRLQVLPGTPIARTLASAGLVDGMNEGEFTWRFRDPATEALWNEFHDVVAESNQDFRSLASDDRRGLADLKRKIEVRLLAAIRARLR
jgi:radical SAM superfamily enzyme YgiQ (UPF0313 family)